MKKSDRYWELLRQEAEERKVQDQEIAANPLIQYSTTELKAELRRRKGGYHGARVSKSRR